MHTPNIIMYPLLQEYSTVYYVILCIAIYSKIRAVCNQLAFEMIHRYTFMSLLYMDICTYPVYTVCTMSNKESKMAMVKTIHYNT